MGETENFIAKVLSLAGYPDVDNAGIVSGYSDGTYGALGNTPQPDSIPRVSMARKRRLSLWTFTAALPPKCAVIAPAAWSGSFSRFPLKSQ